MTSTDEIKAKNIRKTEGKKEKKERENKKTRKKYITD
jgi:hypothetical protein